jgi:thiol-disulfide isomerase/thioredoxin
MKNKSNWIILAALVLLAAWGTKWYIRKTVTPKMEFQTSELLLTPGNKKTTIDDLKGNVAIVSFFQTWCGPCAGEIFVLDELATKLHSDKFKILYISDEDMSLINSYQKRFNTDKIIFAKSTKSLASLGIHVYPTTYLLNKNGEVINSKLEGYNWLLEKPGIEKLLAE